MYDVYHRSFGPNDSGPSGVSTFFDLHVQKVDLQTGRCRALTGCNVRVGWLVFHER